MGHLKDALLVTLDDVQLWVVDGLDGALDQLERLSGAARAAAHQLQDSQVGRAATSGLDDVLSRLEDATAYYLPLPPTLREYSGILGAEWAELVLKSRQHQLRPRPDRDIWVWRPRPIYWPSYCRATPPHLTAAPQRPNT